MSQYVKQVNQCLLRMQNGDREGLTDLFNLAANHLKSVVRVYLTNKSFCEDVVSETFVRAMKYIYTFDPKKDGYNWLCAIVKSQAYNCNVSESKYVGIDEFTGVCNVKSNMIELIDSKIDMSAISANFDKTDKLIFYKRYYENATFEEIGEFVGLTKGAVFKRLKKLNKSAKTFFENR